MAMLSEKIDKLYQAFAEIARPVSIDGCQCCLEEKNISALLSTPLRSISPENLSSYASSAFLTAGDVDDYLYFLPRILEISATQDSWWPDIEITGRAVRHTRPAVWPPPRFYAVTSFLETVVDLLIESEDGDRIDSWLCAIARMALDVQPFLARVEQSHPAILAFFERNASCLTRDKLCNSFWELPDDGHDAIVQWFRRDPVRQVLSDTYGYVS